MEKSGALTIETAVPMSETMETPPRTITARDIFGDEVPTTTPDAVSSPSISSPEEKTSGPVLNWG